MVTARLSLQDAKEKGWLLDGYPRSYAQAQSLEEGNVRPDVYVVLDVCELYNFHFIDYKPISAYKISINSPY